MSATSGGIEVTPGYQPDPNGETITWDKIIRLISDAVLRVQAGSIGPREIVANSITADQLAADLSAQIGVPNKSITLGKLADGFLLPISLGGTGATTPASARTLLGLPWPYLHVNYETAAASNPNYLTHGSWNTRTLNQVKTNTISAASLGSNQITLPAGTYYLRSWMAGSDCSRWQVRIRDITAGATLIAGSAMYNFAAASPDPVSIAHAIGQITLTGTTVIELQYQCSATQDLAYPANFGEVNVWASVEVWKID